MKICTEHKQMLPATHCSQPHSQPDFLKIVFVWYLYLIYIVHPGNYSENVSKKKKDSKVTKGQLKIKVKMDVAHVR